MGIVAEAYPIWRERGLKIVLKGMAASFTSLKCFTGIAVHDRLTIVAK